MAWKLISAAAIVTAALVAVGPAGAQTSSSTQESQSDSGSAATGGATTHPETSESGSVQGSVTTDSPSASPPTMGSDDKEAARARGVDPDKKPGEAVQEKVQEK
jgi:hypothetical protein